MTTDFFGYHVVAGLLNTLYGATLTSSAAIVLILATRKTLCRLFGAGAAYSLWILVPIAAAAALVPPALVAVPAPVLAHSVDAANPTLRAVGRMPSSPASIDIEMWLITVWALGSIAALALLVHQQRRFIRSLGQLSTVDHEIVRAQVSSGCPALIGAWRPRIVLPVDFDQRYSTRERELILAHERSHRVRGDAHFNLLAAGLRCLFWFNPFIHVAASKFRLDQELACDALVIARFPGARRSYAGAMLKAQLIDFCLPVGCHWQSLSWSKTNHPLKWRIMMLKKRLPSRLRGALGAAIATAFVMTGSYAAWAAQPPVRIESAAVPGSKVPDDSLLRIRRKHAVEYPQQMIDSGVEGVIGVRAHVDTQGNVADAHIVFAHPSSVEVLEGNALASIKSWTFAPPMVNGQPTSTTIVVPIRFRIDGHADFPMPTLPADAWDGVVVVHDSPSGTVDLSSNSPPKAIYVDWPDYSESGLNAPEFAKIVVKVHVDETGVPRSAVIDSMHPPGLSSSYTAPSIAAAMQGKYAAGKSNGKPIAGDLLQAFILRNHRGAVASQD